MSSENFDALTRKLNEMVVDCRRVKNELPELEKNAACHRQNAERVEAVAERIRRRKAAMDGIVDKLRPDERILILDRIRHPRAKRVFYAERMQVPLRRYEKMLRRTSLHMNEILKEIEGWEKL